MLESTVADLACPSCGVGYEAVAHNAQAGRIRDGYLACPGCALVIPIIDGFAFFTEPRLHAGQASPQALKELKSHLFGTDSEFARYHRSKWERGVMEPYAAFHPFNESSRAPEALLPHIEPHLQPDDLIVDTWCRTGWSGEWLAGHFPKQRVVAIWEGDSSVLGYRGFRALLPLQERLPNLDIIFADPQRPLPFRTASAGLVHGLDSLHRYSLFPFAAECLRIARETGCLLFPHLHLTNSEPEPYFDRGCNQFHGRDYRRWLDAVSASTPRRGFVLSEACLFNGPSPAQLRDDADTLHYNGAVLMLPKADHDPVDSSGIEPRYVLNPMFSIHLGRGRMRLGRSLHDGGVDHLLQRHPVYETRLPAEATTLDTAALVVLVRALGGANRTGTTRAGSETSRRTLSSALDRLVADEVLRPAPVSLAGHRLQRFHANQLPPVNDAPVADFWRRISEAGADAFDLPGLGQLSGTELLQIAQGLASALSKHGVDTLTGLVIRASSQPLALLAAITGAAAGANVYLTGPADVGPARPGVLLHEDGDGPPATHHTPLPLGLAEGNPDSLIGSLQSANFTDDILWRGATGTIQLELDETPVPVDFAELISACGSIAHQLEPQLWTLAADKPLASLMSFICALDRRERIQASY